MKPKTIILMVIAIACGLGASYMTSQLIANRNPAEKKVEKVTVLTAKKKLEVGIQFKEKDKDKLFKETKFNKGDEPKDSVKEFSEIKDKFLKSPLEEGQVIMLSNVDENLTILPIPEGHQAMGLRVNEETSAHGFAAKPGNRVDLMWLRRGKGDKEIASYRLLQDVLVLAADNTYIQEQGVATYQARVITVALTPEQVADVSLAKDNGTITLSLRKPGDETTQETNVRTLEQLMKRVASQADNNSKPLKVVKKDPVVVKKPDGPEVKEPEPVLQEYQVIIHTPSGVRTVTYMFNKETGKFVSDYDNAVGPGVTPNTPGANKTPDTNSVPQASAPTRRPKVQPQEPAVEKEDAAQAVVK